MAYDNLRITPPHKRMERELHEESGSYIVEENEKTAKVRSILDRVTQDILLASPEFEVEDVFVTNPDYDGEPYHEGEPYWKDYENLEETDIILGVRGILSDKDLMS